MKISQLICIPIFLIFHFSHPANSADSINSSQIIRDGETLVSSGGVFEFGFFSLRNSSKRYVGIWYYNIPVKTYVWVANRQAPVPNNSSQLRLSKAGIFALFDGAVSVWSTNTTSSASNPTARISDSGNLAIEDGGDVLWQSFDYPTDTFLAGVQLGRNYKTGVETFVSSWKSEEDPAPGDYEIHMDPTGYPQMLVKTRGVVTQRIGPWNGLRWSGAPDTSNDPTYQVMLWMNKTGVRYTEKYTQAVTSRSRLGPTGNAERWTWNNRTGNWTVYTSITNDNCDNYNFCGAHGSCTVEISPNCACLERFVPRDPDAWSRAEWLNGCDRRTALNCTEDVFLLYSGIKLPDSTNSTFNDQMIRMEDCEADCKRNCSCTAYTRLNISAGSGCLFYHGELKDVTTMAQAGQDLYIRMASSEAPPPLHSGKSKVGRRRKIIVIASLASIGAMIIACLSLVLILTRKMRKGMKLSTEEAVGKQFSETHVINDADLPFFSIQTVMQATNNFANSNKIGHGGFGPVYKGVLEDGQEIAVKRLSKTSSQGVNELKNEVVLIAKLQHRNLVRTIGCCAEGEENILIYEYMPNSSLDLIIFDQTKSAVLDWQKRFGIINGIAKGLLYLHQDSRLRIIHRDLKASNVLLDADMNPKISDFGLARSFGGNETEAQTRRVVGTYGYMSPEYAIEGLFSIKSDVFSFGVLVLEIVSGKRNRGFNLKDHNLNLIGHAWRLYKAGNSSELIDPSIGDAFDSSQLVRAIHVGLLCVQQSPEDRPNMSSVVFMLGNEVALPEAKQPGFYEEREIIEKNDSNSSYTASSENQLSISWAEGR